MLRRAVTWAQILAVCLVLAGVAVTLTNPKSGAFAEGDDKAVNTSQEKIFFGMLMALASRFASSLNTILAEKFLGKDAKSKIGVAECAVANSVIPFFIVPFGLLISPEVKDWPDQLISGNQGRTTVIFFLSVSLCISKHIDRLSKYGIVNASSTIFFAGIDSMMKILAGIGSFAFFGEEITWTKILGFGLIIVSVVVLYKDKHDKTSTPSPKNTPDYTPPTFVVSPVSLLHSKQSGISIKSVPEHDFSFRPSTVELSTSQQG